MGSEVAEKIRQMAKDYDEETSMLEETLIEPYTYNWNSFAGVYVSHL